MTPYNVKDKKATHVIIELFGGDNNLSSYVEEDMREMMAGNHGSLVVLALADWKGRGAEVIEISPSKGVRSIEALGEIDTGDPRTLADFLAKALVSYPSAERRAIGFWDHGSGVFDEFDPNETLLARKLRSTSREWRTPRGAARNLFIPRSYAGNSRMRAMLHDDTNGGLLTTREAGGVLGAAFAEAGMKGQKVDMIFSDTCLNGMIEVMTEFAPYAEVIAASEELEPGDGWDYKLWFQKMSEAPPTDASAWGRAAVEAFGQSYHERTDEHPVTLAAFRTDVDVTASFKELVAALTPLGDRGFDLMDAARRRSQSFARRNTYDMRDFAERLAKASGSIPPVAAACRKIVERLDAACISSVAWGPSVKGARGLAVWIPTDRGSFEEVESTYRDLQFEAATGWVTYLRNFYA